MYVIGVLTRAVYNSGVTMGRCNLEYHMLHNAEYRMFSSPLEGNFLYLDIDLPDQLMLIEWGLNAVSSRS
jgi:hypothetical protein